MLLNKRTLSCENNFAVAKKENKKAKQGLCLVCRACS